MYSQKLQGSPNVICTLLVYFYTSKIYLQPIICANAFTMFSIAFLKPVHCILVHFNSSIHYVLIPF